MAVLLDEAGADLLDEVLAQILDEAGTGTGWTFSGPETLVYPDYIDVVAGHTLVAAPNGTYQISAPSPVLEHSIPPADGKWTAA